MGNILATIAILSVIWSISLFVLLFKNEVTDGKNSKSIALVVIIGVSMLVTCAYLLNVGEDLNDIITERKSMSYERDATEVLEYKTTENSYVYSGIQAIIILGLLYFTGLQTIWITNAKIKQNCLKNKPRWDLKEISNSINNIKQII